MGEYRRPQQQVFGPCTVGPAAAAEAAGAPTRADPKAMAAANAITSMRFLIEDPLFGSETYVVKESMTKGIVISREVNYLMRLDHSRG